MNCFILLKFLLDLNIKKCSLIIKNKLHFLVYFKIFFLFALEKKIEKYIEYSCNSGDCP